MANYLVDPKTGTVGEATKAAMNVGDKVYSGGGVYVKQADGSFAKEAGSKSTSNWNDVVNSYNAANGGGGGSRGSSYNDDDGFTHTQVSGGGRSGAETTGTLATGDYYRNYALTNNDKIDWYNSIAKNGNVSSNGDGTYTVYDGNQNYMGRVNADGTFTSGSGTTDPTTNAIYDSWGRAAVDLLRSYDAIGKGIIDPVTGQNISYDANAYREAAKAGQDPMAAVSGGQAAYGRALQMLDGNANFYSTAGTGYTAPNTLPELESELQSLYAQNGALDQAAEAERQAKIAAVEAAIGRLNAQKGDVNKSYDAIQRQLYINREKNKKNIQQQMAAAGLTGGAAESTLLGLNTAYEEGLRQGEEARAKAIGEIEQGITDTQLTGNLEAAETLYNRTKENLDSYNQALQILMQQENMRQQQEREEHTAAQSRAYALALSMLESGVMPSSDILTTAGLDMGTAQQLKAAADTSVSVPTYQGTQTVKKPSAGQFEIAVNAALNGRTDDSVRQIIESYSGLPLDAALAAYGYAQSIPTTNPQQGSLKSIPSYVIEQVNNYAEGGMSVENLANVIENYIKRGVITAAQGDEIAASFGF